MRPCINSHCKTHKKLCPKISPSSTFFRYLWYECVLGLLPINIIIWYLWKRSFISIICTMYIFGVCYQIWLSFISITSKDEQINKNNRLKIFVGFEILFPAQIHLVIFSGVTLYINWHMNWLVTGSLFNSVIINLNCQTICQNS